MGIINALGEYLWDFVRGIGFKTAAARPTNLGTGHLWRNGPNLFWWNGTSDQKVNLTIGSDVQAYDAELAALAGLLSAADTVPYFTGSGTAALATLTAFMRTLLDDADYEAAQLTLLLKPGMHVQAYDAELAALAGLTSAADKVPYFTGSGAASVADLPTAGRTFIAATSAAAETAILSTMVGDSGSGGTKGLAPAPAAGDAAAGKFLKADGVWTAPSGGSDKRVADLAPLGNEPPASDFATLDTRNGHPCLDFDPSTSESAIWTFRLPTTYAGGGLTVDIFFSMTSGVANGVVFQGAIERIDLSSLDIDADSFAAAQETGTVTVPGTSGQVVKGTVLFTAGAQMDSIAAGEIGRLKITRDVDDAGDTAAGDAEVLFVQIRET